MQEDFAVWNVFKYILGTQTSTRRQARDVFICQCLKDMKKLQFIPLSYYFCKNCSLFIILAKLS